MEQYFENANVIAEIEKWTICESEFTDFSRALKLPESTTLSLKRDPNRTYMAIRQWLNQAKRSRKDFAAVLDRLGNVSLKIALGFNVDVQDEEPTVKKVRQETFSSQPSTNPFAAALAKKNQTVTVGQFLAEKNNWLSRICVASNNRTSWEQILGELGLLSSPDIEKLVRQYHQDWKETQSGNPTLLVLEQLCHDPQFSSQSIDDFSAFLKKIVNPELLAVVQEWDAFRGSKTAAEVSKNITAFDGARELKDWLIQNDVSTTEDVEDDVAQLRSREFGVKRLTDLLKLRPGSFDKNFSIVKAQSFDEAIAKAKSATKK